ncbi:MAG: hypothetical protein ACOYKD_09515 [Anaerolineaceae bacterium]|jgi:transposase
MKTQEVSAEKLLVAIEEKDRRIAELENQVEWLMSQMKLANVNENVYHLTAN